MFSSADPSILRFTADTNRFYELLEVDKAANSNEIKKAYKKQAVRHHPDKGGDSERFKDVARAYEVLSDPALRARYDEFGEEGLDVNFCPGGPPGSAADCSSVVVETPSPDDGKGFAVGACVLASGASVFCGVSTAMGVALCGAGRVLHGLEGSSGGRRLAAVALMVCGTWLLWPLLGPMEGLSAMAWTIGMYAVTAGGLALLAQQRDRLPTFLPYLLFAGYLLLFLLVPTRSAEKVVMDLPGFTIIEQGEVESDCALAESTALFTWGLVFIHRILASAAQQQQKRERPPSWSPGSAV